MKRLLVSLALLPCAAVAQSQDPHIRTPSDIKPDAIWAAHEAVATLKADGMRGLIKEIKLCYETTKNPAYRCAYLTSAAAELDSGAALTLGVHGYLDDFFNPDVLTQKVLDHYEAVGISEQDATMDITNALLIMTPIVDADASPPDTSTSREHSIPSHCNSAETREDVLQQVPNLLDLPQDSIANVTFLADEPRVMYYPSINGQPARYQLQCPVKVVWNNGHVDYKTYSEKQNAYGQTEVEYNPNSYGS
jgi:hypothetical protein